MYGSLQVAENHNHTNYVSLLIFLGQCDVFLGYLSPFFVRYMRHVVFNYPSVSNFYSSVGAHFSDERVVSYSMGNILFRIC